MGKTLRGRRHRNPSCANRQKKQKRLRQERLRRGLQQTVGAKQNQRQHRRTLPRKRKRRRVVLHQHPRKETSKERCSEADPQWMKFYYHKNGEMLVGSDRRMFGKKKKKQKK